MDSHSNYCFKSPVLILQDLGGYQKKKKKVVMAAASLAVKLSGAQILSCKQCQLFADHLIGTATADFTGKLTLGVLRAELQAP